MLGGRTEGGTNFNVVPADCRFTVDRRLNPEEDLETEKQRLFEVFDQRAGAGHRPSMWRCCRKDGPREWRGSRGGPEALTASIDDVTGKPPVFEMCPGLLETRFYAERGVPAFAYGPGLLSVAHGPKEFVKLDAVLDCATIYALDGQPCAVRLPAVAIRSVATREAPPPWRCQVPPGAASRSVTASRVTRRAQTTTSTIPTMVRPADNPIQIPITPHPTTKHSGVADGKPAQPVSRRGSRSSGVRVSPSPRSTPVATT